MANFVKSGNCLSITHLWLQQNSLTKDALTEIAFSKCLVNLVELNVKQNNVGDEGIKALTIGNLKKLRTLNVNHN